MLDSHRLAESLANRLINELGIPEQARAKMRQLAYIIAYEIVNEFKQNGEIDISDVRIRTDNVQPGIATLDASKQGKGKIE